MRRYSNVARLVGCCLAGAISLLGCLRLVDEERWPCKEASDCENGQKCAWADGEFWCVAGDFCSDDQSGHCAFDERCIDGVCTRTNCTPTNEAHCAPYRCDLSECRTQCSMNAHCSAGSVCIGGACAPPECVSASVNAQCGSYLCREGVCLRECAYHTDCLEGFYCDTMACVPGKGMHEICNVDRECLSGECRYNECTAPAGVGCAGTPPACEERAEASCEAGDGCTLSGVGRCVGGTLECAGFYSCPVGYCFYDSQTGACSGTTSCAGHDSESECSYDYLRGSCTWYDYTCRGTAAPCSSHPAETCESFPGCSVTAAVGRE